MSSDLPHRDGHVYQNINIGGYARVLLGDCSGSGSVITGQADFSGEYAHSSLRPVATYVSRPDLERRLRDQLFPLTGNEHAGDDDESRTVVVWGLGGSGKSQLVLKYVQEHRQQYRAVFWVDAGQKETIERDYLQIHRLLFTSTVGHGSTIDVDHAIAAVKSWLQGQEGRSLWIIDSADSIEDEDNASYIDLNHYLPDTLRLDRIITTRSSRAQNMSSKNGVEVREMVEDEAAQLFRRCAKLRPASDETEQAILAIVQELGCLALAVTLAGSYVAESPTLSANVHLYLPEYQAQRKQILSQKARRHVHQYRESVLSTWELSFAAVQRQSVVAAKLLCLLACLNFDDIFPGLFALESGSRSRLTLVDDEGGQSKRDKLKNMFSRLGAPRQKLPGTRKRPTGVQGTRWTRLLAAEETEINQPTIDAGFATLRAYSLVSWRADQEAYVMHKLVHAWSHDRLEMAERREWSLATLELLSQAVGGHKGDLSKDTRIVPHVVASFAAVSAAYGSTYATTDRDRDSMWTLGDLLHRLGRWDTEQQVRAFLQQATERALGKKHLETLTSMNNLAAVLRRQGQYEQAEEMHRQTLMLYEKVLGREHPSTLTSMSNLAGVLSEQGQYEQAEEMHRQTLKLKEKVLGREHPSTLASMNNLAKVLSQQGQYEQAEEMHRQTLKLYEKVLGREHPNTLASMNNLAGVLSDQGQYEQAEEIHREELKLYEKVRGREHPSTLASMNNLAKVLSEQGQYEQAEEMHRQTLKLKEKVLGREHPSTLTSMNNLAGVLRQQGRFEQAEDVYRH